MLLSKSTFLLKKNKCTSFVVNSIITKKLKTYNKDEKLIQIAGEKLLN